MWVGEAVAPCRRLQQYNIFCCIVTLCHHGDMTEVHRETILAAARDQFLITGVRRTSADDIARRAGINRATLYRRIGTKDDVVQAAFLHETQEVLATITAAAGEIPAPGTDPDFDAADHMVGFFAAAMSALRGNALLRQLLEIDPDETLTGLTVRAGAALDLATALAADRIRRLRAWVGHPDTDDVDDLAATFARLAQSLVLTPDGPPDLTTPAAMATYARRIVVPLVLGARSGADVIG